MSTSLRLDWCSYEAARYAVEHWHYSRRMPSGKLVKVGVWESGKFVGAVVFGNGANNNIGKPYDLAQTEVCELVRVALTEHEATVTRIVSVALKLLKRQFTGLRLVVSYADPRQNHVGGIYQAGNWIYTGQSAEWKGSHYIVGGKRMHGRSVRAKWGSEDKIPVSWSYDTETQKHRYLMPLDRGMSAQIESLRKPYPKRPKHSDDAAAIHAAEGGSTPTRTLQDIDKKAVRHGA